MKQQNQFIKNMNEQLINFETAKLAKERGFEEFVSYCYLENEELYGTYSLMNEDDSAFIDIMDGNELENHNSSDFDRYSAPTQSLLQKWLREKHDIHITITSISQESWQYHIQKPKDKLGDNYEEDFENYEEALEMGLQEALKLI